MAAQRLRSRRADLHRCLACREESRSLPPIELDVLAPGWFDSARQFDAVYCADTIHILPWTCTLALLRET